MSQREMSARLFSKSEPLKKIRIDRNAVLAMNSSSYHAIVVTGSTSLSCLLAKFPIVILQFW